MNNQKPLNPFAFPTAGKDSGMTLRDYFAAQAMHTPLVEFQEVARCSVADLLEHYGTEVEKDWGLVPTFGSEMPIPVRNIKLRAKLESRMRAHLRYIEADSMLARREMPR